MLRCVCFASAAICFSLWVMMPAKSAAVEA